MPTLEAGQFYILKVEKIFPILNQRKRFKYYTHLGFQYDPRDYYLIPGIYCEWDEGYQTPVFFDKDLLYTTIAVLTIQ